MLIRTVALRVQSYREYRYGRYGSKNPRLRVIERPHWDEQQHSYTVGTLVEHGDARLAWVSDGHRMNPSIVNLSRRVADIRSVRAAAFSPRVLALALLFGSVVAHWANSRDRTVIWLIVAAVFSWTLGWLTARGSLWAVLCVAVATDDRRSSF